MFKFMLDCTKKYYQRGTGVPVTLRMLFRWSPKGEELVLRATYHFDEGPLARRVEMVEATEFADRFADTPMVITPEPRRSQTHPRFKSHAYNPYAPGYEPKASAVAQSA